MFHRFPTVLGLICIGVGLLGILCALLPVLSSAEENLGLHMLYLLRGPAVPPADVVVVAIDRESAKALNLPAVPYKWPRKLHARLLDYLTDQQAAVVAFDLIFHEPQEGNNDPTFAAAMRRAGNVIVTQTIDRQGMPLIEHNGRQATQVTIEKLVSAIPIFADAAIGQAPFPLPKVPIKLSQYWRFSPGSGDVPTLPVVVLHAFALEAFDGFLRLLKEIDPAGTAALQVSGSDEGAFTARRVIDMIRPLYTRFEKDHTLAGRMTAELDHNPPVQMSAQTIGRIRALIGLYQPGRSRYLNLYGPPGTIETISYHNLLAQTASDRTAATLPPLKGKAVFVGQTESDWYKANDGFYTVFTQKSGLDLSGVEIAATAFANLLEGKAVYPLGALSHFMVLMVWGAAASLSGVCFSTPRSAAVLVLLNGIYLGMVYTQFKAHGIWYPLVIPVLVQTPAAFIAGLVWKYRKANLERQNIREAFGYYLPDEVVNRLAGNIKELRTGGQVLYSICLFTDAESYTTLSETMDPQSLTELMNTYYEAIFKPIKAQEGIVLQVVGDSVFALWTAPRPENSLKAKACRAAIEITESVRQFNLQADTYPLPTRIGIHAGEILLGNIGAMDHFEYRPVGDIVNTASRLEGLNKFLGTRMLASEEAFGQGNGFQARPVGRFIFKGKSHPVQVNELLPKGSLPSDLQAAVCRIFASGLDAFKRQSWDEAVKLFNQVLQIDGNDGPSLFYLKSCQEYRQMNLGGDWDGTVHLQQK